MHVQDTYKIQNNTTMHPSTTQTRQFPVIQYAGTDNKWDEGSNNDPFRV